MIRAALLASLAGVACAVGAAAQAAAADRPAGTCFVVGGGRLAAPLIAAFRDAAGGDRARLVVIPSASVHADDPGARAADLELWRSRGFAAVDWLHTRDRAAADTPAFVAPLATATAVWIAGGDQRRLAATYAGTAVETALRALLARGGAVGGTSAGAAIATRTMIAGGRERAVLDVGFDLVRGAIVDQHFTERSRLARLCDAVGRRPDHIGLGIDESTALCIVGGRARVLGAGAVTVVCRAGGSRRLTVTRVAASADLDLDRLRRALPPTDAALLLADSTALAARAAQVFAARAPALALDALGVESL